MNLKPNRTHLDVEIIAVSRSPDGGGSEVKARVLRTDTTRAAGDFIQAREGDQLSLFAADPSGLSAGKKFAIDATVLGGPEGERIVLQEARPLEG